MSNTAILYINLSNSICGACGRNADPKEDAHRMEIMRGTGCGAVYVAVSSQYSGMEAVATQLRPDLQWADPSA